jgi:NADPH-dependent F420 reductase
MPMSAIAILGGTGQQGRGLAQRFAYAGARVIVGSRDPQRARETVAAWAGAAGSTVEAAGPPIEVADNIAAVEQLEQGDLTVLAVPFTTVDTLLTELHSHFRDGSIVIDVTVPVTFSGGQMAMLEVAEGSASEHIRARLPQGVQLAAAFKTIPAALLSAGRQPLECDEFVCGDSAEARRQAAALVELLPGARPVDVGALSRARFIEHLTALAIAVNRTHKIHDARFRVVGLR